MVNIRSFLTSVLLLAGTNVHANLIPRQQQCARDNCLRAVVASSVSGSADCASYLATTAAACTFFTTVTTTSSLATVTISVVSTQTRTFMRATAMSGTVSTASTYTTTPTTTVTTIATINAATVTASTTITTAASPQDQPTTEVSCPAVVTTNSATALPAYASSACTSGDPMARYSSVCSCIGVTGTLITTSLFTFTSTVAASTTIAPTRTIVVRPTTTVFLTSTTVSTRASVTETAATVTVTDTFYTTTTNTAATASPFTTTLTSYAYTTTCANAGVHWAVFKDPKTPKYNGNGFSDFVATAWKRSPTVASGATNHIGLFSNPNRANIDLTSYGYTGPGIRADQFALIHKGYIFIQSGQGGPYTFTFTAHVDDIGLIWVGPPAYEGYTRSNAILDLDVGGDNDKSTTVTLVEGYNPIRILYGQADQGADPTGGNGYRFPLRIAGPGTSNAPGPTVVDAQVPLDAPTGFFQQYSCDLSTAPPFPRDGAEI